MHRAQAALLVPPLGFSKREASSLLHIEWATDKERRQENKSRTEVVGGGRGQGEENEAKHKVSKQRLHCRNDALK